MQDRKRHGAGINAIWNVIGGISPAIVAIMLPPILLRSIPVASYGLWAIILQVTGIAAAFGTVAQIGVARFVAIADAENDPLGRDRHVTSALLLSMVSATLLLGSAALVSVNIPVFFPRLPPELRTTAGVCLMFVSLGVSTILPGGVITGQFMGEQRAYVPNAIMFVGRIVQGILVATTAILTGDLIDISMAHMAGNIVILLLQMLAMQRLASDTKVRRTFVSRSTIKALAAFSATLLLWQVTAVIINGIDLVVLGSIDFAAVPYFAIAGTASSIVGGVIGSVYNAYLPAAARVFGGGDNALMANLLRGGLRLGSTFTFMCTVPLILCCEPLLRLWVGATLAPDAATILMILLAALLIRTSLMMYVIVAVATGRHVRAYWGPLLEAGANLVLSIGLGHWLGASGVALGTLASAGLGVGAWLIIDPLRGIGEGRAGWRVVGSALRRPLLVFLPLLIGGLLVPRDFRTSWSSLVLATAFALLLAWSFALTRQDRGAISAWLQRRAARIRPVGGSS